MNQWIRVAAVVGVALIVSASARASENSDRIQPYAGNPFYWQYEGKPALLLGGSEADGAFQWTGDRLIDHLDLLHSVGGNVIRNVLSDRRADSAKPFLRLQNGQYDLERWNEDYFAWLRTFLEETAAREIIVHLTLWDPHDHSHRGQWSESPWNPGNNVTYTELQSGLPLVPPTPYNPFAFYTTVEDDNTVVLRPAGITGSMESKYCNDLEGVNNEGQSIHPSRLLPDGPWYAAVCRCRRGGKPPELP